MIIDFSTSSKTADDAFKARGGFVINCDHGGGHCGGGLARSIWEFFEAHAYGVDPEPWTALPAALPQILQDPLKSCRKVASERLTSSARPCEIQEYSSGQASGRESEETIFRQLLTA